MGVLGVGIDICRVARMQGILSGRTAGRFLQKALHVDEQTAPVTPQFLASRWAVKEALVKASGRTDLVFRLVKVEKLPNGRPVLALAPSEMEKLRVLGGDKLHVSLSHEDEYAVAVVVLETSS